MKTLLIAILLIGCSPKLAPTLEQAKANKEQRKETRHLIRNYAIAIVVFGMGIHYVGWDLQKQ